LRLNVSNNDVNVLCVTVGQVSEQNERKACYVRECTMENDEEGVCTFTTDGADMVWRRAVQMDIYGNGDP
jgi:hypothetical protein